ncbi:MAG: hypothetical protein MK133_12370, partial [Planctomycetes bacterium]|nr:hypothetical protein [Planctomycetota bacterium]
ILVPDGMAGISAEENKVSLRNAVRIGNAEEILLEEIDSLDTNSLFAGADLAALPDLLEPLALENALRILAPTTAAEADGKVTAGLPLSPLEAQPMIEQVTTAAARVRPSFCFKLENFILSP